MDCDTNQPDIHQNTLGYRIEERVQYSTGFFQVYPIWIQWLRQFALGNKDTTYTYHSTNITSKHAEVFRIALDLRLVCKFFLQQDNILDIVNVDEIFMHYIQHCTLDRIQAFCVPQKLEHVNYTQYSKCVYYHHHHHHHTEHIAGSSSSSPSPPVIHDTKSIHHSPTSKLSISGNKCGKTITQSNRFPRLTWRSRFNPNFDNNRALKYAIHNNNVDVVEWLLKKHPHVSQQQDTNPPIKLRNSLDDCFTMALVENYYQSVALLLRYCPNLTLSARNYYALKHAISRDSLNAIELFLSHAKKLHKDQKMPLNHDNFRLLCNAVVYCRTGILHTLLRQYRENIQDHLYISLTRLCHHISNDRIVFVSENTKYVKQLEKEYDKLWHLVRMRFKEFHIPEYKRMCVDRDDNNTTVDVTRYWGWQPLQESDIREFYEYRAYDKCQSFERYMRHCTLKYNVSLLMFKYIYALPPMQRNIQTWYGPLLLDTITTDWGDAFEFMIQQRGERQLDQLINTPEFFHAYTHSPNANAMHLLNYIDLRYPFQQYSRYLLRAVKTDAVAMVHKLLMFRFIQNTIKRQVFKRLCSHSNVFNGSRVSTRSQYHNIGEIDMEKEDENHTDDEQLHFHQLIFPPIPPTSPPPPPKTTTTTTLLSVKNTTDTIDSNKTLSGSDNQECNGVDKVQGHLTLACIDVYTNILNLSQTCCYDACNAIKNDTTHHVYNIDTIYCIDFVSCLDKSQFRFTDYIYTPNMNVNTWDEDEQYTLTTMNSDDLIRIKQDDHIISEHSDLLFYYLSHVLLLSEQDKQWSTVEFKDMRFSVEQNALFEAIQSKSCNVALHLIDFLTQLYTLDPTMLPHFLLSFSACFMMACENKMWQVAHKLIQEFRLELRFKRQKVVNILLKYYVLLNEKIESGQSIPKNYRDRDSVFDILALVLDDDRVDPLFDYHRYFKMVCKFGLYDIVALFLWKFYYPQSSSSSPPPPPQHNSLDGVMGILDKTLVQKLQSIPMKRQNLPELNPSSGDDHALRYACQNGHHRVVKLLLNWCGEHIDPCTLSNQALYNAITQGYVGVTKQLLKHPDTSPNLNVAYTKKRHTIVNDAIIFENTGKTTMSSAFSLACQCDETEILRLFLKDANLDFSVVVDGLPHVLLFDNLEIFKCILHRYYHGLYDYSVDSDASVDYKHLTHTKLYKILHHAHNFYSKYKSKRSDGVSFILEYIHKRFYRIWCHLKRK